MLDNRAAAVRNGKPIAVALAKRIVNLIDHGSGGAAGRIAKENAQRIETVAEYPRHTQQPDRAAREIDARAGEESIDLFAQGLGAACFAVSGGSRPFTLSR
jgi:hypothetical protein